VHLPCETSLAAKHIDRLCHAYLRSKAARCHAEEDEFWQGISAVTWLGVPELQQQITVTGYPVGGDSLSITQGIVSRVTMSSYTSGGAQLMNVQVSQTAMPGRWANPLRSAAICHLCADRRKTTAVPI
jgi:hypothetical protein